MKVGADARNIKPKHNGAPERIKERTFRGGQFFYEGVLNQLDRPLNVVSPACPKKASGPL
jgi:hypothetical protein